MWVEIITGVCAVAGVVLGTIGIVKADEAYWLGRKANRKAYEAEGKAEAVTRNLADLRDDISDLRTDVWDLQGVADAEDLDSEICQPAKTYLEDFKQKIPRPRASYNDYGFPSGRCVLIFYESAKPLCESQINAPHGLECCAMCWNQPMKGE